MGPEEEKLRRFLNEAVDEAGLPIIDSRRVLARTKRYQFIFGISLVATILIVVGGVYSVGASLLDGGSTKDPIPPAQATPVQSESPSPGPSSTPSEPADEGTPDVALQTGNGRVPLGDVTLCPTGDLTQSRSVSNGAVAAAVRSLLESANGNQPDTERMWSMLDPSLQAAYGSLENFQKMISRAPLDDAFREWSVSDEVFVDSGPVLGQLISDTCGTDVAKAIVVGQASFPQFEGLSGGAAQLYFVAREDGTLRFWLLD